MRVFLRFSGRTLGNGDITEELLLTEQCNAEGQLMCGEAASAQLKFEVENCGGELDTQAIAGDFSLYTGEEGAAESILAEYGAVFGQTTGLFVKYGQRTFYCGHTLYEAGGEPPEQPSARTRALFVVDETLYCAHDVSPYVTAYSLEGGLTRLPAPTLDAFDIKRLRTLAAKGAAFTLDNNGFSQFYAVRRAGNIADYCVRRTELTKRGEFTVSSVKRKNERLLAVTAFDGMTALDRDASEWIQAQTYPVSAAAYLDSLCQHFEVSLASQSFLNSDYAVLRGFEGAVTARQLAGFIAQLACGFARMTPDGALEIKSYQSTAVQAGAADIISAALEDRPCAAIDRVHIRVVDEDVGCIVGTGENAYIVQNNPLLYALDESELSVAAGRMYAALSPLSVTSGMVRLTGAWFSAGLGDIITIVTPENRSVQFYVMKRELRGVNFPATTLGAFGSARRSASGGVKTSIIMLRGATNKLTRLLNQTTSTITQIISRLSSAETSIIQNAAQIALKAAKSAVDALTGRVDTAEASITTQAGQIALKASQSSVDALGNRVGTAESSIIQNANQIALKVSQTDFNELDGRVGSAESSIIQNANQIALKVSQTDFNALRGRVSTAESSIAVNADAITSKVSRDGVISSINQTAEQIKIAANKLTLDGLVTVTGLSGGTTQINGACITTGKISADRINVPNIDASKITSGTISADRLDASVVTADDLTAGSVTVKTQNSGSTSNWTEMKSGGINCYTANKDVLIANGMVYVGTNDGWSGTHGGQIEAYSNASQTEKGISVKAPAVFGGGTAVVNLEADGVIYASANGTQRVKVNSAGVHLPNLPASSSASGTPQPVYIDTNGKLFKSSAGGGSVSGWSGTIILLNANNTPTLIDVTNGIITNSTDY